MWDVKRREGLRHVRRFDTRATSRLHSCRMSTRKQRQARVGLLQSTLDLLIQPEGARFYELTRQGRTQLVAETNTWGKLTAAIGRILGPEET